MIVSRRIWDSSYLCISNDGKGGVAEGTYQFSTVSQMWTCWGLMEHNSIPRGFILAVRLRHEHMNQIAASQLELARLLFNFCSKFPRIILGADPIRR
jgi:hypothetical protein